MFRTAFLAVVWLLVSPLVAAQGDSDDPAYWLGRLGPALTETSYRGVFVYVRGDQVSSMRVAHRYRNGMVEERLVMQDGQIGEILRKGSQVICVLPEQGRVELTGVIPSVPLGEAFANQLMPVDRWYRAEVVGSDRIAGHDVVRLALNARDNLRYSHQLWLEQSTGLPLKGVVLSGSGDMLEYFHFTSVTIGENLSDQEFVIRTQGREVSRTLSFEGAPVPERAMKGWNLGWKPDGFQPAAVPDSKARRAVAFSDGLASFSVFVEPASAVDMPTGASRIGATTVYMKKLTTDDGDFLVTVVGEIPLEAVVKLAESVEIEKPDALEASLQ